MTTEEHLKRIEEFISNPLGREHWVEAMESLTALRQQIGSLTRIIDGGNTREQIAEMERRASIVVCPNCDSACGSHAPVCWKCGASLEMEH